MYRTVNAGFVVTKNYYFIHIKLSLGRKLPLSEIVRHILHALSGAGSKLKVGAIFSVPPLFCSAPPPFDGALCTRRWALICAGIGLLFVPVITMVLETDNIETWCSNYSNLFSLKHASFRNILWQHRPTLMFCQHCDTHNILTVTNSFTSC